MNIWLKTASPDHETGEELEARVMMIAEEVERLPATVEEKALVAATIHDESQRFHLSVHEGTKRGDRGRAWCLGQLHNQTWLPRAELELTVGTDREATRRCLMGAVQAYRGGGKKLVCSSLDRAIAMYATGRGCSASWSGTGRRLRLTWQMMALMRKAGHASY